MEKIETEYLEYFTGKKKLKSDMQQQHQILSKKIQTLNDQVSFQDGQMSK